MCMSAWKSKGGGGRGGSPEELTLTPYPHCSHPFLPTLLNLLSAEVKSCKNPVKLLSSVNVYVCMCMHVHLCVCMCMYVTLCIASRYFGGIYIFKNFNQFLKIKCEVWCLS